MAALTGNYTGRIIYTHEELKTRVRDHMAALISSGRWFDKDAYKECHQILKKPKSVCAIIPEDEEASMEHLMNRFMRVFQKQGHAALINRTLFEAHHGSVAVYGAGVCCCHFSRHRCR